MKSVPPLNEMFDMAGMELPTYLGKKAEPAKESPAEIVTADTPAAE